MLAEAAKELSTRLDVIEMQDEEFWDRFWPKEALIASETVRSKIAQNGQPTKKQRRKRNKKKVGGNRETGGGGRRNEGEEKERKGEGHATTGNVLNKPFPR